VRLSVVIWILLLAGCGGPSRPETVPISGRVTYGGQPVVSGQIVFYPEPIGSGRQAIGAIGPDGRYTLTTFDSGDGAVLGRHRVTIKSVRVSAGPPSAQEAAEQMRQGRDLGVEWLVPKKYSRPNTTPLTAEVKRGKNTIDFDLPSS
jgi:hypothetical protein